MTKAVATAEKRPAYASSDGDREEDMSTYEYEENVERAAPAIEHCGVMGGRLFTIHLPHARRVACLLTNRRIRRKLLFEVGV